MQSVLLLTLIYEIIDENRGSVLACPARLAGEADSPLLREDLVKDSPQKLPQPWHVELKRGLDRLHAGQFDRAAGHFARAHRWAPKSAEVCYALGRERMRQSRFDEAERLLRAAWRGDDTLLSAGVSLARCLALHLGRHHEAMEVLDSATMRHGALALIHVVRSELQLDYDDVECARVSAEAAIALCDQYEVSPVTLDAARAALARVCNREGIEQANAGDHEAALFTFKQATHLDPWWSSPHVNMGAAFAELGRPRRACACYRTAVEIEPDNPISQFNLGISLRQLGEPRAAMSALKAAIELDPALSRDAWIALGDAQASEGEVGLAETSWREALRLDPEHVGACCRLADRLTRDGRYIEAAVWAQRAHRVDPDAAASFLSRPERP